MESEKQLLADLAERFPGVKAMLEDTSMGRRAVADKLQALGFSVHHSAVRRWRASNQISTGLTGKAQLATPYPDQKRPSPGKHRAPEVRNWQPGVTITGTTAEIKTPLGPATAIASDREILEDANLDPDEWYITKVTTHQTYDDRGVAQLKAYWVRAAKQPRGISADEVEAILGRYYPVEHLPGPYDDRIVMVPSGDLQLGKPEGGGTEAIIRRFARYTSEIEADLAASGGIKLLILPWLGDCIEGIVSQNGRNIANLDIPITAQVRIYRRLMLHQIITFAPYAEQILVPVVPGNHDQTTREQMMPHTDSWAIEGASATADALKLTGRYDHVSWAFPDEGEPHLAVRIDPKLTMGFTHGHVTGTNPARLIDWWKGQSHGRQSIGEADILVSAHWHHLRIEATGGGRTWIQIPACDGGSGWYRHKTGEAVVNGQITVDLTPGAGVGWTNLKFYT